MDRAPKPAPFPVGTRIRYLGERCTWTEEHGKKIRIIEPRIEVTVDEVKPGRRGTLRHCRDDDGPMYYEDGEPILDDTRDGYSVYHSDEDVQRKYGRIIERDDAPEWEVVA